MKPRIFVYKVTFEEIPDWYWGVHKETKYNDGYWGSPTTHAWKWNFYTPNLEICELFPYTDEGWKKARSVEDRCILPDLNNPLCLNEHTGGQNSLEASRRGGTKGSKTVNKIIHAEKDDLGRSVHSLKAFEKVHEEKDELGKSVHATKIHKEKDELGRSLHAIKALGSYFNNPEHQSKAGKRGAEVANAAMTPEEKSENGRKGGKTSSMQIWQSTIDGFRGRACSVALHNKANGWDKAAKIRIS